MHSKKRQMGLTTPNVRSISEMSTKFPVAMNSQHWIPTSPSVSIFLLIDGSSTAMPLRQLHTKFKLSQSTQCISNLECHQHYTNLSSFFGTPTQAISISNSMLLTSGLKRKHQKTIRKSCCLASTQRRLFSNWSKRGKL